MYLDKTMFKNNFWSTFFRMGEMKDVRQIKRKKEEIKRDESN